MPHRLQCLWPWAHRGSPTLHRTWTSLLIKAVEPSFGKNKCPMGHSAYTPGPMGGHLPMAMGPCRGHPSMAIGPWEWTSLLIKAVELSFDKNRCPMGPRGSPTYDHGPLGGHLPMAMGPWGVPHRDMMDNHALWALFKNPTPIQVASLIGDKCTIRLDSYIHDRC